MTIDTDYPLFIPPAPLFKKKAEAWSSKEAKQYFDWVLDTQPSRVKQMLGFLNENLPQDHREWEKFLLELGARYSKKLRLRQFSENRDGKVRLTNQGAALAGDVGLLGAQLLIQYPGSKVHWEQLNDPGAFGHNLPVLKGFVNSLYFDPIGGTIYEAKALLKGEKAVDLLHKAFVFWKNKML
jgi:hypothetical protein